MADKIERAARRMRVAIRAKYFAYGLVGLSRHLQMMRRYRALRAGALALFQEEVRRG